MNLLSTRAWVSVAVLSLAPAMVVGAAGPTVEDLTQLTLEELSNVQVTSVSKSPEPLRRAPAAIYVITHEQIVRSGATSIAEALRLAPNMLITQQNSSAYTGGARGFGGHTPSQNFANKLLILIDGRSVYSPLFSGIYYDTQDVLLEDVDRIEVISGPGATLWGANAMNGVINIVTRPAYLTDGVEASVGLGTLEQNASFRYGDKLSYETAYRFYGKAFKRSALDLPGEGSADDEWYQGQGGLRFDWLHTADELTVQGDFYRGIETQAPGKQANLGVNALARWQHHFARSDLQVQSYFDQVQRQSPAGNGAFVVHTYDLEIQQSAGIGAHRLVWGAGERLTRYSITNSASLLFLPNDGELRLGNLFAQDTIALGATFKLTAGIKFEHDPYAGWAVQPDLRVAWDVNDATFLWASAARAIRSPTPFDEDVAEVLGGQVFLAGNPRFRPEEVVAYEVGYRGALLERLSVSLSAFYNDYDELRTIEPASDTEFLPLRWDNQMTGHTHGLTAWGHWQVRDWWRLSPGVALLRKHLRFKPGASGLLGVAQAGDDPDKQASLNSSMDIGRSLTFDAMLRYVGALPEPAVKSYYELNARLGWHASERLELSISGFNLLHRRHMEAPAPEGILIPRSVIAEGRWSFR